MTSQRNSPKAALLFANMSPRAGICALLLGLCNGSCATISETTVFEKTAFFICFSPFLEKE